MTSRNAQVLFPVNLKTPFDYSVPEGLRVEPGSFVFAPLGNQMKLGVVWGLSPAEPGRSLKPIAEDKPCRPLPPETLKFVNWVARYNCANVGMVLRMVLRSLKALDPSATARFFRPSGVDIPNLTSARQRVLERGGPFPARASEIAERAGVSPGVVNGLTERGGLIAEEMPVDPPFDIPDPSMTGLDLTDQQSEAAEALRQNMRPDRFSVSLLDGVTGSGKTEVYFEAVAKALEQGRQVLVLVPEIALTQAGLERFRQRFGAEPAPWHSALGDAARRRTWREAFQGRAQLVVGARSALFLPFRNLGLIVVDEEHDGSYKQEEGVIYGARDMAVVRGLIGRHAVILASATPSLESMQNARSFKYHHVKLPERPGAATLPDIDLIDLKEHPPEKGAYLSEPLRDAIAETLATGDQTLLYLNRRGYAPLIVCRKCGEKLRSPDTDSWLVEHKASGRAMCHLTGFSMRMPKECPSCGAQDSLASVGPGVERIAEEVETLFPQAKVEILSSDTSGNAEVIRDRLARMAEGDIDILVGTQMVVKGHNFPKLTLVGVVDGDLGMIGGDPRAGERTFQTLVQVAGRAGRADRAGRALIQTHQPENEALVALQTGDRDAFVDIELAMREVTQLPPFGRLASVIISSPDLKQVESFAKAFVRQAPRAENITILGPSEPPIGRLRGKFRRRVLVQSDLGTDLSEYMRKWREQTKNTGKISVQIDIDPMTFL